MFYSHTKTDTIVPRFPDINPFFKMARMNGYFPSRDISNHFIGDHSRFDRRPKMKDMSDRYFIELPSYAGDVSFAIIWIISGSLYQFTPYAEYVTELACNMDTFRLDNSIVECVIGTDMAMQFIDVHSVNGVPVNGLPYLTRLGMFRQAVEGSGIAEMFTVGTPVAVAPSSGVHYAPLMGRMETDMTIVSCDDIHRNIRKVVKTGISDDYLIDDKTRMTLRTINESKEMYRLFAGLRIGESRMLHVAFDHPRQVWHLATH